MTSRLRMLLAALLAVLGLLAGACSAEGDVDTEGDGIEVEGDVDANDGGDTTDTSEGE